VPHRFKSAQSMLASSLLATTSPKTTKKDVGTDVGFLVVEGKAAPLAWHPAAAQ